MGSGISKYTFTPTNSNMQKHPHPSTSAASSEATPPSSSHSSGVNDDSEPIAKPPRDSASMHDEDLSFLISDHLENPSAKTLEDIVRFAKVDRVSNLYKNKVMRILLNILSDHATNSNHDATQAITSSLYGVAYLIRYRDFGNNEIMHISSILYNYINHPDNNIIKGIVEFAKEVYNKKSSHNFHPVAKNQFRNLCIDSLEKSIDSLENKYITTSDKLSTIKHIAELVSINNIPEGILNKACYALLSQQNSNNSLIRAESLYGIESLANNNGISIDTIEGVLNSLLALPETLKKNNLHYQKDPYIAKLYKVIYNITYSHYHSLSSQISEEALVYLANNKPSSKHSSEEIISFTLSSLSNTTHSVLETEQSTIDCYSTSSMSNSATNISGCLSSIIKPFKACIEQPSPPIYPEKNIDTLSKQMNAK